MLRCNINNSITHKEKPVIDFNSLKERLREMFPNQYKSEVEQFIESKNPKSASDVEHWMQQWTYSNEKYLGL
jgi:hypothetical protein